MGAGRWLSGASGLNTAGRGEKMDGRRRPNTMRRRLSAVRLVESLALGGWSFSFSVMMQGGIVQLNCLRKRFKFQTPHGAGGEVFLGNKERRVTLVCWAKRENKKRGGRPGLGCLGLVGQRSTLKCAKKGPDPDPPRGAIGKARSRVTGRSERAEVIVKIDLRYPSNPARRPW